MYPTTFRLLDSERQPFPRRGAPVRARQSLEGTPEVVAEAPAAVDPYGLTRREREVLARRPNPAATNWPGNQDRPRLATRPV